MLPPVTEFLAALTLILADSPAATDHAAPLTTLLAALLEALAEPLLVESVTLLIVHTDTLAERPLATDHAAVPTVLPSAALPLLLAEPLLAQSAIP